MDGMFKDWKIEKCIGKGSFGKVYEIHREDFGHVYKAALKVIKIPQERAEVETAINDGMTAENVTEYFYGMVEKIVEEFALMSRLKGNSTIVSYEDHHVEKNADGFGWTIYIRMELLTPLYQYIKTNQVTVKDIIQLGIDMCQALEICQKYNIIHRDIKPENIFVSDLGTFKLGDFGIARELEKTSSGLSKVGTKSYMAPEVYKGTEYNSSVDIYSLGVVLYRFLNNNRLPFMPPAPQAIKYSDKEKADIMRMSGQKMPKPCNAGGRLAEIVLKACEYNPKDRYDNAREMRKALEAIMYSETEKAIVYPRGDVLENSRAEYVSESVAVGKKEKELGLNRAEEEREGTQYLFAQKKAAEHPKEIRDADKAEQVRKSGNVRSFETVRQKGDGDKSEFAKENGSVGKSEQCSVNKAGNRLEQDRDRRIVNKTKSEQGKADKSINRSVSKTEQRKENNSANKSERDSAGKSANKSEYAKESRNINKPKAGEKQPGRQGQKKAEGSGVSKRKPHKKLAIGMGGVILLAAACVFLYQGLDSPDEQSLENPLEGRRITTTKKQIDMYTQPPKITEPPSYSLVDIVGKTKDQALQTLNAQNNAKVECREKYSDDVKKGIVIAQSPKAGERFYVTTDTKKYRVLQKVVLTVSKGEKPAVVPDLTGKTLKRAQAILEKRGLRVKIKGYVYSNWVKNGGVVYQSITSGKKVKRGCVIVLTLSKGKKTTYVAPTPAPTPVLAPSTPKRSNTVRDIELPEGF